VTLAYLLGVIVNDILKTKNSSVHFQVSLFFYLTIRNLRDDYYFQDALEIAAVILESSTQGLNQVCINTALMVSNYV